jgi:hypothetical protein
MPRTPRTPGTAQVDLSVHRLAESRRVRAGERQGAAQTWPKAAFSRHRPW